ncbi:hypothetical protein E2C01_095866 [Portunus trituberculatus]|uniref:Uncharacterized protein n=1 Tax=Portunus trituberculatus TaxID=210409 RepID=A0A5B7K5E5_PORTR|nr:hypothetical protein [Portunus trituberculatus]
MEKKGGHVKSVENCSGDRNAAISCVSVASVPVLRVCLVSCHSCTRQDRKNIENFKQENSLKDSNASGAFIVR